MESPLERGSLRVGTGHGLPASASLRPTVAPYGHSQDSNCIPSCLPSSAHTALERACACRVSALSIKLPSDCHFSLSVAVLLGSHLSVT